MPAHDDPTPLTVADLAVELGVPVAEVVDVVARLGDGPLAAPPIDPSALTAEVAATVRALLRDQP